MHRKLSTIFQRIIISLAPTDRTSFIIINVFNVLVFSFIGANQPFIQHTAHSTYVTAPKTPSTEHIVIKLNSCSLVSRPHLHSPHWVLSDLMLSVNKIMVQYRAPCVLAAVLRSIIFYLLQRKYKQCTTNSTKCTYKWFHHSPIRLRHQFQYAKYFIPLFRLFALEQPYLLSLSS